MENKIFVIESKGFNYMNGYYHYVIVVAGSDEDTVQKYVNDKIGLNIKPTWLMNATYPTIYVSDGSIPEPIQAKILYNGSAHFKKW